MKTTHTFLVFIFTLLSISTVSAQYGGNGYGNNGYGRNGYGGGSGMNQMGGGMNQGQPEKPKEIPAEETASKIVAEMKPALNLDELQVIAITNVLIESLNTEGRILKQDTTQDEQTKDFQALLESTDRKINQFLSKEQKGKYVIYKEERKNQKKSKSKSKKEKEKKE